MTLCTGRCCFNCILRYVCKCLIFAFTAACISATIPSNAQAMWLSIYGNGGYDTISSKPADANSEVYVEPNPNGPSFGLGVSIEPMRFVDNMIGISVGAGLSGWSLSWSTPEAGKIPAGVSISTFGLGINGALNVYLGDLFLYLISEFDYGLFSSKYVTTRNGDTKNPNGQTFDNKVNSMMRLFAGLGLGYKIGGFKVALQGGLANVAVNLTAPPGTTKQTGPAEDSYAGWSAQLVVGYDILAPKTEEKTSTIDSDEDGKKSDKKKKSKKKKPKKKKPKKK